MKRKYIVAIWQQWRDKDDGNWYLWWPETLALRIKATLCVLLGLYRTHDYRLDGFGVGMVNFHGPYADYENGGQQATWTQIDVARYWSEWWYTDFSDAWQ